MKHYIVKKDLINAPVGTILSMNDKKTLVNDDCDWIVGNDFIEPAVEQKFIEEYTDKSRIRQEYEDEILDELSDISDKPWRAIRYIKNLFEKNIDKNVDYYTEVIHDYAVLEEFYYNGGHDKLEELISDTKSNVEPYSPEPKHWRAENGGSYYTVDEFGNVCKRIDYHETYSNALYKSGNYYRTEATAELVAKARKLGLIYLHTIPGTPQQNIKNDLKRLMPKLEKLYWRMMVMDKELTEKYSPIKINN